MNKETPAIILVSAEKIGKSMAGPGIRYFEFARTLANHFKVLLFIPNQTDIQAESFQIKTYDSNHPSQTIAPAIKSGSVIISQSLPPFLIRKIKKQGARFIADLYDPSTIEVLEYAKHDTKKHQEQIYNFNHASLKLQIKNADHLLCANEQQKDFYFGLLSAYKQITPKTYDQTARFFSLVPFGLPSRKPVASKPKILEDQFPQIKDSDKIVYWGGGIWDWFDPISVIKALELISKKREDVKLFFFVSKHPNPKIRQDMMAAKAMKYAEEKGLLNTTVFFNPGPAIYEDRVNYLLRSSIGVSTHFDNLETHFSFRTRVLDYLWAELPMVLTRGDVFAELADRHQLGYVVDFEDIEGIAEAIVEIIENPAKTRNIKNNIAAFKTSLTWDECLKPLINFIKKDEWPAKRSGAFVFYKNSLGYYWAGTKKKFFK